MLKVTNISGQPIILDFGGDKQKKMGKNGTFYTKKWTEQLKLLSSPTQKRRSVVKVEEINK